MPLRLVMAALLCTGMVGLARGNDDETEVPYRAYITTNDVYVRSGPGTNYYPVQRLKRGDVVEVYRHDPGGWYAIRPLDECFSWIAAEFVEPRDGNTAEVVATERASLQEARERLAAVEAALASLRKSQ